MPHLHRALACALLALLACPSGGTAEEAAKPLRREPPAAWAEAPVRLVFSFTSRDGSNGLAAALIELAELGKDPRFADALSPPAATAEERAHCLISPRSDPSGRFFDTARCLRIWPGRDKAPEPKLLEHAFTAALAEHGIAAFPAVSVTTFDFQLRLQPDQIPSRLVAKKYRQDADGKLQPTPEAAKFLCDPRVTFIAPEACRIEIVRRLETQQPDIFVSQTGYRLELAKTLPRHLAQAIGAQTRERALAQWGGAAPEGALVVSMAPVKPTGHGLQALDGTPTDLTSHFAAPWNSINTSPAAVELTGGAGIPPNILLFDNIDDTKVSDFQAWYQGMKNALAQRAGADCSLGDKTHWHVDAAASLFFPGTVQALIGAPAATPAPADPTWSGSILTAAHFEGVLPLVDSQLWWQPGAFGLGRDPVIAVVVYSDPYGLRDDDRAAQVGTSILANPSNLLVIATPQAIETSNYDADPVSALAPTSVQQNCPGKSWPSCLGKHPRVLVIAPSRAAAPGERPALFAPEAYVLGGSTVKLAAPGNRIPVVSPCSATPSVTAGPAAPQPEARWTAHDEDGSSFAAPIVGLVLARLIEVGPERMRDLPEAAIWRVLATADPFLETGGTDPRVAFGEINVGRALLGIDRNALGTEGRATIYERPAAAGEAAKARHAVVLPYPWNDAAVNLAKSQGAVPKPGVARYPRGVLTYTEGVANDGGGTTRAMDFKYVLRIVRHRSAEGEATELFDLYYLSDIGGGTLSVQVKRGVRLGVRDPHAIRSPGFCSVEGLTQAGGASPAQDAQPACLYAWDPEAADGSGFRPLDLSEIDDIVLPPLHLEARFVAAIDPTDLRAVTRADSPWRAEFCKTGPRRQVRALLGASRSIDDACWK